MDEKLRLLGIGERGDEDGLDLDICATNAERAPTVDLVTRETFHRRIVALVGDGLTRSVHPIMLADHLAFSECRERLCHLCL